MPRKQRICREYTKSLKRKISLNVHVLETATLFYRKLFIRNNCNIIKVSKEFD